MDAPDPIEEKSRDRISEITLDPKSLASSTANIEHEREVAIFDIIDGNSFAIDGIDSGPYKLHLAIADDRLQLRIGSHAADGIAEHSVPLTPLKRIMKDYFMVCESYYAAVRTAPPARIQAIDVNRRGLHDEGSTVLKDRLLSKIVVDNDTARRLFTLLCALHWKG
jgi:uncharacterized protein (UPF0262 family)